MDNFTLPKSMKDWTIGSLVAAENGREVYSLSRKGSDGSVINAVLTAITAADELYTKDNISYFKDEAEFLGSVAKIEGVSNYIDAAYTDNSKEKKISLLIITDGSKPLSEYNPYNGSDERDVVEFGLRMSGLLEKLEAKNIYHGNIKPENIFVREDGSLCLGGFTELEAPVDSRDYLAPEIAKDEDPDFTTDIYSLGLIMYKMCNSGKLPFEGGSVSKEDAIEKRLSKSPVTAPANGSEKLRSVIVIACQPAKKNRWKNAGNIRNALSSIKDELPFSQQAAAAAVVVPEATGFDGNVFEEYDFDATQAGDASVSGDAPAETNAEGAAGTAEDTASDSGASQKTEDIADTDDTAPSYTEPEIDNRVFDDFETGTKIFSIQDAQTEEKKDYGDFFDEPDEDEKKKPAESSVEEKDNFDDNSFGYAEDEPYKESKSRKGLIAAIIIAAVIVLALLGVLGIIAVKNGWFGKSGDNTTATTVPAATTSPAPNETTAPATTVQPTTASPKATESGVKTIDSYIGWGYYYAEQALNAEGYEAAVLEYKYSDEYEEGLVIEQTPGEGSEIKPGDTVYLTVSLGSEQQETTAPEEEQDNGESAFSSYKNNTSYLSQSEVDAMSGDELNLALNEIYARRGRIFTSPELVEYFSAQSWYRPLYTAEEFSRKVVFNDYEAKNITLLYNEQVERGYR